MFRSQCDRNWLEMWLYRTYGVRKALAKQNHLILSPGGDCKVKFMLKQT